MTREEEILNDQYLSCYVDKKRGWINEAFLDGVLWADSRLEDKTDWQKVRIQAAIAAMQGIINNEARHEEVCKAREENLSFLEAVAKEARIYADSLIEELKREIVMFEDYEPTESLLDGDFSCETTEEEI